MKKLICVLLLFAVLISCCACGGQAEPTQATTEATQPTEVEIVNGVKKPDLSGIDEFTPNSKGVYQIYSKEGFLNIANHPDAEFEILWHIDMEGTVWTPVGTEEKPFTGEIDGGYFTVSNFVIDAPTADGDMGIFGVMDGQVKDLTVENVTLTTTDTTKRAGLWAGYNCEDGQFLRCYANNSAMVAEQAADNAAIGAIVGVNEGEFRNGTMDIDLTVTAPGAADVGGIAGYVADGKIQFIKNAGFLDVTGSNKNTGLFAGAVTKDAEIKGAVFLGEKSDLNGEMFLTYTGSGDASNVVDCLWRDNKKETVDPAIQAKRDQAEQTMREMGSVVWTVPKTLKYTCTCSLGSCAGLYQPGVEIHGIVYNHKSSSLERLLYCLDENNMLKEDFFLGDFDGFDRYIGSDCSAAVQQALMSASSTVEFLNTRNMVPAKTDCILPVGDWEWNLESGVPTYYDVYMEATGEERMYEAYACLRKGDFIVNQVEAGGHTRLVAADAVVVRDSQGKIDGMESYVLTHEQGAPRTLEPYFSSWRVDYKYSFSSIFVDWYVPCTIREFVTGEFVEPQVQLVGGVNGKFGMTTGLVDANYYLDSVELTVTDSEGEQVFTQRMFTAVGKSSDANNNVLIRRNVQEFDLARFATPLREYMFELGEDYTYTITAYLGSGDVFVVKEGTFTNGTAA